MTILYGTGNSAKLLSMRKGLNALNIEIIGLKDLKKAVPDVLETGNTPLEMQGKKGILSTRN